MSSKQTRIVIVAFATALLGSGAYWYWSPYLAINSMKSSAEAKDADSFNQHVDYIKLRESLKGQFNAKMAGALKGTEGSSDMERAGSSLGAMIGLALVDKMIDAMVRPEMVMKAMSEAKLQNPTSRDSTSDSTKVKGLKWVLERKSTDKVIAYGAEEPSAATPEAARVGFVFDREGFASWKLTEIRLPTNE